MSNGGKSGYIVDMNAFPKNYPTHICEPEFWESLGRAIATFGFLEEILERAIFLVTATRPYKEDEIEKAYDEWLLMLEKTIADPLGSLIKTYGKSIHAYSQATDENLENLLKHLNEVPKTRNILCHGSWGVPDSNGRSVPRFVNRKKEVCETAIDCEYLNRVQRGVAELACEVIQTTTRTTGRQFPGSSGVDSILKRNTGP